MAAHKWNVLSIIWCQPYDAYVWELEGATSGLDDLDLFMVHDFSNIRFFILSYNNWIFLSVQGWWMLSLKKWFSKWHIIIFMS